MRPGLRASLLLLALGPLFAAAAEPGLRPFNAAYSITWHGMSAGSTELTLAQLPDGRWSYSSQSSAKGLFRLAMPAELSSRSVFHIEADHIVPESFTAEDGSSGDEKDQHIAFDWNAGRVTGVSEQKPVDLPIQPGLLDSLSVQVALMHALLAGHVPERIVVLDKSVVKDYLYTAQGQERLSTKVGDYDTVIYRSARPGSKNGTYFWCAPALGFLPLKVERREGDNVQWSMAMKRTDLAPAK